MSRRFANADRAERPGRWRASATLAAAFLAVALCGFSGAAHAATWEGIDVLVDREWPGCGRGGYFPLRISVVNRGQPRTMTLTFGGNQSMPTVTKTIAVQTERVNFSLLVPCVGAVAYGELRVAVDGSNISDLMHSVSLPGVRNQEEIGPAVLLVDTRDTDWSTFKSALESIAGVTAAPASSSPYSGYTPTITAGDDHKYVPPDSLPGEWQAYTGLDIVTLALSTLQRVDSADRDAILRWVDAGGTLLVYSAGAGEGLAAAEAVDKAIASPAGSTAAAWSASGSRRGQFLIRERMLGRIVAVPADPFHEFSQQQWETLLNSLGRERWDWSDRHGFSARTESSNFMDFLVPSVKGVPVFAFLVLITLFAIVIGPVNYIYLWKQKRLYLLIVTIPAIAAITSVSLLGYSAVAHGFATRSRVRSLTLVDQPSMTAVSSSRVSYYSGLAPSSGLHFTRDTAVYPIWAPEAYFENGSVDWTEDQHLASGWLRSRTRTQFLVTTERKERGRLDVQPQAGMLSVSNGFEWDLESLVVTDDDGRLFFTSELAAGDGANLEPLKSTDSAQLSAAINANPLQAPPYAPQGYNPYTYRRRGGYDPPQISYSSNQTERLLTLLTQSTTYSPNARRKRWYAAILRENPGLDLGLPSAREEASVHVLMGNY